MPIRLLAISTMAQKRINTNSLFAQPVLFSKRVNASLVDTFLSPEQTNSAMIAETVVPTNDDTILGSGIRGKGLATCH